MNTLVALSNKKLNYYSVKKTCSDTKCLTYKILYILIQKHDLLAVSWKFCPAISKYEVVNSVCLVRWEPVVVYRLIMVLKTLELQA